MKIMDEKGRLFGKLNIIDLLVLVAVAAAAFFLGGRLLGGGGGGSASQPVYLEFTVRATGVDPASYETVRQFVDVGAGLRDQLMANGQLLDGYVVDVVATPHISYDILPDSSTTAVESTGADTRLDLLFTCVATVTDPITQELGTQEIRAGIPHILKTTHFEFQASRVISVKWLDEHW